MNEEPKSSPKKTNFPSPLHLVTSFPDAQPSIIETPELMKERNSPQTVRSDLGHLESPRESFNFRDFDLKKQWQKLSQFKFDNLFQGDTQPENTMEDSANFKLKRSRCVSKNRFAPTKKIFDIEEKLKQINGYFKSEFLQKRGDLFRSKGGLIGEVLDKHFPLTRDKQQQQQHLQSLNNLPDHSEEETKFEDQEIHGQRDSSTENRKAVGSQKRIFETSFDKLRERIRFPRQQRTTPQKESPDVKRDEQEVDDISGALQSTAVSNDPQERLLEEAVPSLPEEVQETTAVTETTLPTNVSTIVENGDQANAGNEENGQQVQGDGTDNLNVIVRKEANFRLRRALMIFLSALFSSVFLSLMLDQTFSHRALFLCLYAFLAYYFVEGFKKVIAPEVIQWKRVENVFNTVDMTSVLLTLIMIDLKMSGLIERTNYTCVLPLVSSSLYYFTSKAPKSVLESQTVTRILFTFQIFLITSRIDGMILWPWKSVVCLLWIYLGMMVLYFILLAFMMVLMLVLALFGIHLYQNMNRKTQIIGFLWYLSYIGLGPLYFATLIGFCEAYDEKQDFVILKECMTIIQYFCIAAIIFTRLTYPTLIIFLQKFNIDEPEFRIQIGLRDSGALNKIEVEKKNIYLVMLSSTYFLPLKQSFLMKSQQNLKRCKEALLDSKNRIFRKGYLRRLTSRKKREKNEEPITFEELRKDQEELSKKLEQGNYQTNGDLSKRTQKTQKKGLSRERSFHLLEDFEMVKFDEIMRSPVLKYKGMCFSEGDKDYIANWALLEHADERGHHGKETDLCYICFEKTANSVIMPCGHGGICYECAIKFVKGSNQCMECRGAIENVIKINPNPQMRGIIRGYETSKLIGIKQEKENEDLEDIIS